MNDLNNSNINDLYQVFLKLETLEDCKDLFDDLCTYKELEQMLQRVNAARYLLNGETYDEVIKKTNISSATLSRVSKCVKYGKGYKKFVK